jgi:hypothetical protein
MIFIAIRCSFPFSYVSVSTKRMAQQLGKKEEEPFTTKGLESATRQSFLSKLCPHITEVAWRTRRYHWAGEHAIAANQCDGYSRTYNAIVLQIQNNNLELLWYVYIESGR